EIQAVLRTNDIAQQTLTLKTDEANPEAVEEIRRYIENSARASHTIILREMVETRFATRPYGWPEMDVLLIVARLMVAGEISLVTDGAPVPPNKAYEILTTSARQRRATIVQNRMSDSKALGAARKLGKEVFSEMGPEGEEPLVKFLRIHLEEWQRDLTHYKSLADTGNYPGATESAEGITLINALLAPTEYYKFIERFNERGDDLTELAESYRDLHQFHQHQKTAWDRLRRERERFTRNALQIEQDDAAGKALRQMQMILEAPAPYSLIQESTKLIEQVDAVNRELITKRRAEAAATIDSYITRLRAELEASGAGESVSMDEMKQLESFRAMVGREESLAHISQLEQTAVSAYDVAIERIAKSAASPIPSGDETTPPKSTNTLKPRRIVKPAELVQKTYIETIEDVNGFLDAIRRQLEEAIANGERIEIR
ncbi:MAG: hypothetical protein ABI876_18535, partial [Bacteroidota bacterium]